MGVPIRQILINLLKFAFAAGLIGWMVHNGTLDFSLIFSSFDLVGIVVLSLLYFILLLNNNFRWFLLLKSMSIETTYRRVLSLGLIGMFFNFAMPGGVGGDLIKGYYLVRDQEKAKTRAALTVIIDRILGMTSMLFVGILAFFWQWENVSSNSNLMALFTGSVGLFIGIIVFFVLALSRKLHSHSFVERTFARLPGGGFIRKIHDGLVAYRDSLGTLFIGFSLSVFTQVLAISFFVVAGRLMSFDIPLAVYFYAVPLSIITVALPVAPGGIGVGQAATLVLFSWALGYESQVGPNTMTAFQLIGMVWGLIGAVIYFRLKSAVTNKTNGEQLA